MLSDLSFQDVGKFRTDLPGNSLDDWAVAVRVTRDDKIVVAGPAKTGLTGPTGREQKEFVAARFLANGQLDPDFGSNGIVRAAFTGIYYAALYVNATEARALAVQEDGKVIVGRIAYVTGAEFGATAVLLVRFNNDVTFDNTFGDRGAIVDNYKWPLERAILPGMTCPAWNWMIRAGYLWEEVPCSTFRIHREGRLSAGTLLPVRRTSRSAHWG